MGSFSPKEEPGHNRTLFDLEEKEGNGWNIGGDPGRNDFDFGLWIQPGSV
ncbi:hypothetical protein [Microbulbifer variabilis]|nr:hypothetical protein [Microbulbifer variabilis]